MLGFIAFNQDSIALKLIVGDELKYCEDVAISYFQYIYLIRQTAFIET